MKKSSIILTLSAVLVILTIPTGVSAITHTVNFGGSLGLTFSPSSFTATVGDTVKWIGDFTMHTTTSTSVPATAATWDHGATTSTTTSPFIYVIHVAGTYAYHCTLHYTSGMTGSFSASASAIRTEHTVHSPDNAIAMKTVSASGTTTILLNVPAATTMSVEVFNSSGKQKTIIANHRFETGAHQISLSNFPKGVYFAKISANGITSINKFALWN
jgi:plastocyanin